MTPGGKYILAEGQQCSEKSRSLTGLMGTEIACGLAEGVEGGGGKHEQSKCWREENAGSGGTRSRPLARERGLFNPACFG